MARGDQCRVMAPQKERASTFSRMEDDTFVDYEAYVDDDTAPAPRDSNDEVAAAIPPPDGFVQTAPPGFVWGIVPQHVAKKYAHLHAENAITARTAAPETTQTHASKLRKDEESRGHLASGDALATKAVPSISNSEVIQADFKDESNRLQTAVDAGQRNAAMNSVEVVGASSIPQQPAKRKRMQTKTKKSKHMRMEQDVDDDREGDDEVPCSSPKVLGTRTFNLGDEDATREFFAYRMRELTLSPFRVILKDWVGFACPERRRKYRKYHKQKPSDMPAGSQPDWWPHNVLYMEPAHLREEAFIPLATEILLLHRREDDEGKARVNWIDKLQERTYSIIKTMAANKFSASRDQKFCDEKKAIAENKILPNLFHVARKVEDYDAMLRDGLNPARTQISYQPVEKVARAPPTRKPRKIILDPVTTQSRRRREISAGSTTEEDVDEGSRQMAGGVDGGKVNDGQAKAVSPSTSVMEMDVATDRLSMDDQGMFSAEGGASAHATYNPLQMNLQDDQAASAMEVMSRSQSAATRDANISFGHSVVSVQSPIPTQVAPPWPTQHEDSYFQRRKSVTTVPGSSMTTAAHRYQHMPQGATEAQILAAADNIIRQRDAAGLDVNITSSKLHAQSPWFDTQMHAASAHCPAWSNDPSQTYNEFAGPNLAHLAHSGRSAPYGLNHQMIAYQNQSSQTLHAQPMDLLPQPAYLATTSPRYHFDHQALNFGQQQSPNVRHQQIGYVDPESPPTGQFRDSTAQNGLDSKAMAYQDQGAHMNVPGFAQTQAMNMTASPYPEQVNFRPDLDGAYHGLPRY